MRCISLLAVFALAAMPGPSRAEQAQGAAPSEKEIAKRKEELARLERRYRKEVKECQDGNRRACTTAQNTYAQIQLALPTIPAG